MKQFFLASLLGSSIALCTSAMAADTDLQTLEAAARAEGAEIHWGDETALVNTDVRGRSYAPRGKTPVTMAVGGTREKLSMISTVTNRGGPTG